MDKSEGVSFAAILNKATTQIDGGWRITFDVSEDDSEAILQLSKMRGEILQIGVIKVG